MKYLLRYLQPSNPHPPLRSKEQSILLLFCVFWNQLSLLLFLQNLVYHLISFRLLGCFWRRPVILHCILSLVWRAKPKTRTTFKRGPCCYWEKWRSYSVGLPLDNPSWKYQMPSANGRTKMESLQTAWTVTFSREGPMISARTNTFTHVQQHESLIFKMSNPSSLRTL